MTPHLKFSKSFLIYMYAFMAAAWIYRNRLPIVLVFILSLVSLKSTAMLDTIPDRRGHACEKMLYPTNNCDPDWVGDDTYSTSDDYYLARIIITVDDFVSEPDTPPATSNVHASTLWITTGGKPAANTYQVLDDEGYGVPLFINLPPCILQSCVPLSRGSGDYHGLTEEQMTDMVEMTDVFLWQWPDDEMSGVVREAHGVEEGLPIIVYVIKSTIEYTNNRYNNMPSIYSVWVVFRYMLPYV